jgi:O-acetyl-ADP-ribose deacetylase (regulator of RNase III)
MGGTGGLQIWRIGGLDELLVRGCDWLKDYVITHPEALEKLAVCQNRIKSIQVDRNLAGVGEVEDGSAQLQNRVQISNPTSNRILWVDDNLANNADEITRLQEKGIEVTEAVSTDQAMQILMSSGLSFNAIITDMGRTEEGEYRPKAGIALIKAARKASINLPILVYTTLTLYARTIDEVVAAGGNAATMSAEELFALLKNYTGEGMSTEPQKASKLAPAPTSVAPRRFVITVSKDSEEGFLGEFLVRDKLVKIYQGDITNLVTDVIVSSDDNYLTMGGGVSARIRHIGGENIYRQTRNLIPLFLGDVAVTRAGKLRARKLFHAVVIDFDEGEKLSDKVIQRVVHSCMKKASLYDFRSIAFPLLGTGAAGFPAKVVWEIMFRQIIRDLSTENQNISEVIVAIYERVIVEELKIKNFLEAIEEFGWKSLL